MFVCFLVCLSLISRSVYSFAFLQFFGCFCCELFLNVALPKNCHSASNKEKMATCHCLLTFFYFPKNQEWLRPVSRKCLVLVLWIWVVWFIICLFMISYKMVIPSVFFYYPPSSGIASCVGTARTVT